LDQLLLQRLGDAKGDLLENTELISVLAGKFFQQCVLCGVVWCVRSRDGVDPGAFLDGTNMQVAVVLTSKGIGVTIPAAIGATFPLPSHVTSDTKRKAISVTSKLSHAAETRASLNEKREVYRAIARRGSVLYFAIADLAAVNPMYQVCRCLVLLGRLLHVCL
jgi:hypothetical protein